MFSSHHSEHNKAETSPLVDEPHNCDVQSPVSNYSEALIALVNNFEDIIEGRQSQVDDFTFNGQPLNLTISDNKVYSSKHGSHVVKNGKLVLTLTALKQVYQFLGKAMPIHAMSKYAEQSQSVFGMFSPPNEVQQAVASVVEEFNNPNRLTM